MHGLVHGGIGDSLAHAQQVQKISSFKLLNASLKIICGVSLVGATVFPLLIQNSQYKLYYLVLKVMAYELSR